MQCPIILQGWTLNLQIWLQSVVLQLLICTVWLLFWCKISKNITTQSVACPHTQHLSMMPIVAFTFDLWPPKSIEIILSPWFSAKFDEEAHNGLVSIVVVVDCGLTSHSAIFQLYSDGTDVRFQILTCCRAPTPWAAFSVPSLPRHGHRDVWRRLFTSLPSEGPHAVRVSGESNPDLPIQSQARYLCATAAG